MKSALIAALVTCAGLFLGCASRDSDVSQAALRERMAAADRLARQLTHQLDGGWALTIGFTERLLRSYRQAAAASVASAQSPSERTSAAAEYSSRVSELQRSMAIGQDVTRVQLEQAGWYRQESELLLMLLEGGASVSSTTRFQKPAEEVQKAAKARLDAVSQVLAHLRSMPPAGDTTAWSVTNPDLEAFLIWSDARLAICASRSEWRVAVREGQKILSELSAGFANMHVIRTGLIDYIDADLNVMLATGRPGALQELDELLRLDRPKSPAVRQKANERLAISTQFLRTLQQREEGGEALTPAWMMLKARAHRRAFDARLDIAENRPQRLAAAEEYLARAKSDLATVEGFTHQYPIHLAIPRYQVADAQYEIARIKAGR